MRKLGLRTGISSLAVLGGGPSLYLGQVATRCFLSNNVTTSTAGWNTRTGHYARDDISAIQVADANWRINGSVEDLPTNIKTVRYGIEYPEGNFNRITWGGLEEVVIPNGDTAWSDLTTLSVTIPRGAHFRIWRHESNSARIIFCSANQARFNIAIGDAVESSSTDKSMGGVITDNGNNSIVPVAAIRGYTRRPSIAAFGSSRMIGSGDTADSSGDTGYARMFGGDFGYLNYSVTGRTFDGIAAGTRALAIAKASCSHLWVDPGLNDFNSGASLADLQTDINTVIDQWPSRSRVIINNEGPWTGKNATFNNKRFALNDWIDGMTGINQSVNAADFVETSHQSNVWKDGYSLDGVHETQSALLAMVAASIFNPDLVRR